jgi:glycine/D-amino acid oxidase-like deaminating enzyme
MGTTVRRIDRAQGGDRIVVRSCAAFRPSMETGAGQLRRAERAMRAKFDARFPQLAGMAIENTSWAGHLCLSLQRRRGDAPRSTDGVYTGCVQNGLGTARGTLTGIGAAELACGATSDVTAHFTAEDRPKRLPPRPLSDIGANLTLRWKEWRARTE